PLVVRRPHDDWAQRGPAVRSLCSQLDRLPFVRETGTRPLGAPDRSPSWIHKNGSTRKCAATPGLTARAGRVSPLELSADEGGNLGTVLPPEVDGSREYRHHDDEEDDRQEVAVDVRDQVP